VNGRIGRTVATALLIVSVAAATACRGNRPPEDEDYVGRLLAEREAKNTQFTQENDPVPPNRKAQLLPLAYFSVDEEYSVPAALKPIDEDLVVELPTSTGEVRAMRRAGMLEFSLKGQPMKLMAFSAMTDRNLTQLNVMFSDLTSGTETYAAGRYIDLERNPQGIYQLDFNRAYNPYCYYNESYECPFPPPENRLTIPIRAGERVK
jgi:uncharacterized protein (DUF1684 family)